MSIVTLPSFHLLQEWEKQHRFHHSSSLCPRQVSQVNNNALRVIILLIILIIIITTTQSQELSKQSIPGTHRNREESVHELKPPC